MLKNQWPVPKGTIECPQAGDIRTGITIGKKIHISCVWRACNGCGKESWVELRNGVPRATSCRRCSPLDPDKKARVAATRIRLGLQIDTPAPRGTLEVPQLGDMRRARDIGLKGWALYIFYACPVCSSQYWLRYRDHLLHRRCGPCSTRDPNRKAKATQTAIARGTQRDIPMPQGTIELPKLGDVRRGHELGYASNMAFVWSACDDCKKERWVVTLKRAITNRRCHACGGRNRRGKMIGSASPAWRGGRYINTQGYVEIWVSPDDFFHTMCFPGTNHMQEHRYVMAKKLGRLLHSWEDVHHNDLDHANNNIKNLVLKMRGHGAGTTSKKNVAVELEKAKKRVAQLEGRVSILEAESVLLSKGQPERILGGA